MNGGLYDLSGCAGTIIGSVTLFDSGDIANPVIWLGKTGNGKRCAKTTIEGYHRNGGTAETDIFLGDADATFILSAGGISAAKPITIDANGNELAVGMLHHANVIRAFDYISAATTRIRGDNHARRPPG